MKGTVVQVNIGRTSIFSVAIVTAMCAAAAVAESGESSEVATAEPSRGVESLERLAHFEIPASSQSEPSDLRWASHDSVLVSYVSGGIVELELVEGLPVKRRVFPPRSRQVQMMTIHSFGASAGKLFAAQVGNILGWVEAEAGGTSDPRIKGLRGYFDDVDLSGETVAILGYPTVEQLEKERSYLWLGSLDDGLERWKALSAVSEEGDFDTSLGRSTIGLHLGSLRFLAKDELIVVPALRPGVLRVARSGKALDEWSPDALEASLLDARGIERVETADQPEPMRADFPTPEWAERYIGSQRFLIVESLAIEGQPAILVRHGSGREARLFLGLLEAEIRWFELPVKPRRATDLIRADYEPSKRRLAILLSRRGGGDGTETADLYVLTAP